MPSNLALPSSVLDQIVLYPFNVVHPAPPTALAATYTTNPLNRNQSIISVTWTPPTGMPDVSSFNVYRNDVLLGNVPASASPLVYVDTATGGDVQLFTYYATSVDVTGVESAVSASICNFSQTANQFISELRSSLKDRPSDPRVQRWTDDDLWLALRQGMSRVNAIPVGTNFNFDSAPQNLFNYIIVASRIAALRSQASLEAAKEFSMGVGGATININRSSVYNSLVNGEDSSFAAEIKAIKLAMVMTLVHGEGILTSTMPFKIRTFSPRQYRVR